MESELKKTLKAVTLELRHLLEGRYGQGGQWKPGDLEQRLASIGVRRDRASVPVDELGHLTDEDRQARKFVDAYLKLRDEAGLERSEAVAEFVRETAYTWANRLLALRCMEARELIDSVILQQEAYGGRSLEHHRLAQRHPELCAGDDDGLFAVLYKVFRAQAGRLPMLFDPQAPGISLRPSAAALKDCFGLLSLNPDTLRKYRVRLAEDEAASPGAKPPNPFTASDALGWAYQYWNTEEKNRVFETVRTVKGAKIAGADIIPATQLYTEDYMVKFLVQNSLGATWMGMHPGSKLAEKWEYYVKDADRAPVEKKPVREITFLDPACGSGHFHLEAFDLLYAMYQEEGELTAPEEICNAILTKNLFGIDIDPRAVQIAEVALLMKAAEKAFDYKGVPTNLVAATSSHLKGEAWEEFLAGFEREPSVARVLRSFARTMEHIDEIGSLARPAEDLREIIKEEHATWERQVSEKKEANYIFPEMNEAIVSGQLPFQEISDDEFGDRLFYRAKAGIDAFTERARASGDFEDQMLGSETRAGFRLVDLLSRRYDVVTANPPYLGSKHFSTEMKEYITRYFPTGRRDLFSAFILRCQLIASESGRVGIVAQESWMFLKSFAELRAVFGSNDHNCTGLLRATTIEIIARLGPGSFSEISGEVVKTSLLLFSNDAPNSSHELTILAPSAATDVEAKAQALRAGGDCHRHRQATFIQEVAGSSISYWIPPDLWNLLEHNRRLSDIARARKGMTTMHNERFLRWVWEAPGSQRWIPFVKSLPFCRWRAPQTHRVDWQFNGMRAKTFVAEGYGGGSWSRAIANVDLYFKSGCWCSIVCGGTPSFRLLQGAIFETKTIAVVPDDAVDATQLMAYLNTNFVVYLLRAFSPGLETLPGAVERLPLPDNLSRFYAPRTEGMGVGAYSYVSSMIGPACSGDTFSNFSDFRFHADTIALADSVAQHWNEFEVVRAFNLPDSVQRHILDLTGHGSAALRVLDGFDKLPDGTNTPSEVSAWIATQPRYKMTPEELARFNDRLRRVYEAGLGLDEAPDDDASDGSDDEDGEALVGTRLPIPPESFLEDLAQKVELHPISVYWLLRDGIEREGWRCLPEELRWWGDRITVTVLRLIGHGWPNATVSSDPIPDWAAPGGIIPLTPITNESMLIERVRQRLRADEIDAADCAEVMSKPLDDWLATEFFKYHTKQFKKRPIAWQLQSDKFTAKKPPAFACLLYYHKLDADMLPKLSSQYIGPSRQRLETELRGILAIAADARSERQVKRRGELDDAILELQKFDTVLATVARSGFVAEVLRQNAVDDAMLALKARWLRRLTELIAKSPLRDWLAATDRTELHPDFRVWVADVLTHLDYFCARVGPKAPDQSKLTSDPIAADLAKLITPHANEMLKNSLELACDQWWKQFDEVVLGPDKDRIKTLREEQRSGEEQLAADPPPLAVEARDLKYRVKEIKEEVKILTAKIKRKAALANTVRTQIEGWQSKEPAGWGDWLAGQPLFDRIASLDGRRSAPTTIAEFITQESLFAPDINDGVRVNIAPLQKAGVLAADVLAAKDIDKAIADRAEWRADERRWVREGKLPQPGWWPEENSRTP